MEFEDIVKIINDQIFVVAEKIENEDGYLNVNLLLAGIAFSSTSLLKSASFGDEKAFFNSVDGFCDLIKSMAEIFIEENKKRN